MLVFAIIFISMALVFYTLGVLGERFKKTLLKKHLVLFWIGLVFDTLGTSLMSRIADGVFSFNAHGISGILAIALMAVHAVWATFVLLKGGPRQKANFHKFSLIVWLVWLIPYFSGLAAGVSL